MMNNQLSICIIGKGKEEHLSKCIESASKLSKEVIYINSGADDENRSKAAELGASFVDPDSLSSTLQSKWVLFLKSNEVLNLSSKKSLHSMLGNKKNQRYLVCTKSNDIKSSLENYQLIQNLEQYKNIGNETYVTIFELRLVRKAHASSCLEYLLSETSKEIPNLFQEIIKGLSIEFIQEEESKDAQADPDEHDRRCLKGEIYYGPVPGEELDELSYAYNGYRILHMGYLDGFMESANRGLGSDLMYLPMLEYLCNNGSYKEAKDLFEVWIRNRSDDERVDLNIAGGVIYANLFMLDEAIACHEKANEIVTHPSTLATLGKLFLIKGQREKAITAFKKSIEMQTDPSYEHVLYLIKSEQWRPMKLSLCMIAKDEEDTIGKALDSMKNIADEIIVVDTGSSDRTMDIVREYGGKIIETSWGDDFSAARNVALKEAQGDYVFILDADEFIDISNRIELAFLKKILPSSCNIAFRIRIEPETVPGIMSVSYQDRLSDQECADYQVRLFPRQKEILFTGNVFESVDSSLRHAHIQGTDVQLFKITHQTADAEFRNSRKLNAIRKSFVNLKDPTTVLEGGLFFLRMGELKEAYPWFEKIKKANPRLLSKVVMLYSDQQLYNQAKKIAKNALKEFPDSSDLHLSLARVYFKEERYDDVYNVLSTLVTSKNEDMDNRSIADAFYYYGVALLEKGHTAQGIEHIAQALEKDPFDTRYQVGGLHAFGLTDKWEEFFEVSGQIISLEEIEIDFEIEGFFDIGRLVLVLFHHFVSSGGEEEAMICQKIITSLVHTKIVEKEEINKMAELVNETNLTAIA